MSLPAQQHYQTQSAILFITFNRPDTTQRVFDQIKQVRPKKLYVSADGPRPNREHDARLCQQVKAIFDQIDWDCELKTLYRENNLGCKTAVSSAIDWFFAQEEEGIILEDDCLPAIDFFKFCDAMLERYRFDNRVRHITGTNLNEGMKIGDAAYYFSNQTIVWGWAGWRRVWKDYDVNLSSYNEEEVQKKFEEIFADKEVANTWVEIFTEVKANKIDTWDYQYAFLNYFNNGLSATPNVNLISNIGFGADATHTFTDQDPLANIALGEIGEIKHPNNIVPDKAADLLFLRKHFRIPEKQAQLKKHNSVRRRFKRWFKGLFKKS